MPVNSAEGCPSVPAAPDARREEGSGISESEIILLRSVLFPALPQPYGRRKNCRSDSRWRHRRNRQCVSAYLYSVR